MSDNSYQLPFNNRYSSVEMQSIFSPLRKYTLWRALWITLAEAQKNAGINITARQIADMRKAQNDIDFNAVRAYERQTKHEVMAHIKAFADKAPSATAIIHLGATSVFVMDNGDLIQMKQALQLIQNRIVTVLRKLARHAEQYKDVATLAYTHFQPAQPTTIGKRCSLWAYSLQTDLQQIMHCIDMLELRGLKGTTGTQASFRDLNISHAALQAIEQKIAEKFGFKRCARLTAQSYDRKVDYTVLTALSAIAQSAHKFATDVRLLQGLHALEEPFDAEQVGSTAMPYKRNPISSERLCSLAKFVMSLPHSAAMVAATQWLEHTLDDSAARRLHIPQAFLGIDAILILYTHIVNGMQFLLDNNRKQLAKQLPFILSEKILMDAVQKGGDRQALHERIRVHAMEAIAAQQKDASAVDFMQRILNDDHFHITKQEQHALSDIQHRIGYAAEQVSDWLTHSCNPLLKRFAAYTDDVPNVLL